MLMKPDDSSMARGLASDYYKAAEEDYELLEYIRLTEFSYYGNGCMLAARYAEKIMKARLLLLGIEVGWTHDQKVLVNSFPDFEGKQRALEIASILTSYATQAAYPSMIRDNISPEDAEEAYDLSMELVILTSCFETDAPNSRIVQTTLSNKKLFPKKRGLFDRFRKRVR